MVRNQTGDKNPYWKGGKVKTICRLCGKNIYAHASRKKQFCDVKCYKIWQGKYWVIPVNCKNSGRTHFKKSNHPKTEFKKGCNLGCKHPRWKGIEGRKERRKKQYQKRKAIMRGGGDLPIKRIQLVYEDNIKKYGTLTCIYCLQSIEFGKDTLEHKHPLSRGGTNDYSNLAIACRSCNSKKNNKTYDEYCKIGGLNEDR
jgi:5-methylcytosine-specific restriction endonuclease McrA